MWLGMKHGMKKMENVYLSLHVRNYVIEQVPVVRDLGVLPDSELSMEKHVSKVASNVTFTFVD